MNRRNWLVLFAAYVSILVGGWAASQLKVDFSLTTLSTRNSEAYRNYQEYTKRFPVDEDGLAISLRAKNPLNSREAYLKLEQLRLEIDALNGVDNVLGITSMEVPEKSVLGTTHRKMIRLESEKVFQLRYQKLRSYPDVTPKFLSEDRTATRIFLQADWEATSLAKIQQVIDKYDFSETHFMGKEAFLEEMKSSLSAEMYVLPLVAGTVLLILFFLWFRDVKSLIVVMSVLAVNLALLCTVFWLSGIKIGLLTSTTPLLIVVLSFSDIVHILYKYKQQDPSISIHDRLKLTIRPLRLPLWLTSLTTAIAFAIFFVSGIDEIMEFAFSACFGIILAYFTARFLLPIFIESFNISAFQRNEAFRKIGEKLVRYLPFHRAISTVSLVLIGLVVVASIALFEINISFHQTFGEDSGIGKSLRFTDDKFDGVRTVEVILKSKDGLNTETIQKVDSIEKLLLENYQCRSVFSVNTAIKRLNRYTHFGISSHFKLPAKFEGEFLQELTKYKQELGLVNAMTDDQKIFRIAGRLPDIGSLEANKRNEILAEKLKAIEGVNHSVFISGFSFVKDQSSTRITLFILVGVVLSLLIAALVIGIVFKSVRIAIMALLVNALPVFFGLLLMQLIGIELNPTTAMALSIILGLALDDTIYLLSGLKQKKAQNDRKLLESCIRENTFPASVTSIILTIGFGILMLSSIESNRNIGFLVATMLLIALISDLVILPALLRTFWTKRKVL